MIFMLNPVARRSAIEYGAALIEACKTVTPEVDPLSALEDTDAYPRLRKIPELEFIVGWLNATACVLGKPVRALWAVLGPLAEQQYARVAVHAKERKRPAEGKEKRRGKAA